MVTEKHKDYTGTEGIDDEKSNNMSPRGSHRYISKASSVSLFCANVSFEYHDDSLFKCVI